MAQAVSVDCALPFVDGDSEWVFLPSACLSVAPDRSALQRRIKTLSRCQVSDTREVENEDYRGSRWLRRQPHLVSEPEFIVERKSTSCYLIVRGVKGIVPSRMNVLSSFTHPFPNLCRTRKETFWIMFTVLTSVKWKWIEVEVDSCPPKSHHLRNCRPPNKKCVIFFSPMLF